jgi:hypothetical protein
MSKIMKANKKIEKAVVSGYKTIEDGVVGGYKKVENKFVEAFLTPDDSGQDDTSAVAGNQEHA